MPETRYDQCIECEMEGEGFEEEGDFICLQCRHGSDRSIVLRDLLYRYDLATRTANAIAVMSMEAARLVSQSLIYHSTPFHAEPAPFDKVLIVVVKVYEDTLRLICDNLPKEEI